MKHHEALEHSTHLAPESCFVISARRCFRADTEWTREMLRDGRFLDLLDPRSVLLECVTPLDASREMKSSLEFCPRNNKST